jgi:hypothetical protein
MLPASLAAVERDAGEWVCVECEEAGLGDES